MKLKSSSFSAIALGLMVLFACETDDIEPKITLSIRSSAVAVSEASGTLNLMASLNTSSDQDVSINLALSGTATANVDYSLSANSLVIPAGGLSASIQLTAIQDTLQEGNETIDILATASDGVTIQNGASLSLTIEDDDVQQVANLIVNEILYDPPSGLAGDANGDGTRSPSEDEFIEFYNASTLAIDLGGYKIYDSLALSDGVPRHIIPANTVIQPGKVLVVFGGGTPTGSFGGATVQASTTGNLNLTNDGDLMTLTDPSDVVILTFDIEPLSNNPDESYTRNPDITGNFEQHNDNTPLLFSPGTKIDGTPF